jgi:hypothetical protein
MLTAVTAGCRALPHRRNVIAWWVAARNFVDSFFFFA